MAETNMEIEQAALELGVAAVLLRRYLDGQETVALDVVDRALIHANRTVSVDGRLVVILDDLYPLLDDAAEAA